MKKLEYIGKIPMLQGKIALIRSFDQYDQYIGMSKDEVVLAQFDDMILFNGKNMGTKWHPFPAADFREPGQTPIF